MFNREKYNNKANKTKRKQRVVHWQRPNSKQAKQKL